MITPHRPVHELPRSARLALSLAGVVLATAGCASRWATPTIEGPTASAPTASPVSPPLVTRPAVVSEFEARHRDAVENASQANRWAEVIWSLDVLQALRPDDTSLPLRRQQAEQAAQALVTERLRQAKQAQQRGDAEAAQRNYLDVLALQPAAASQADAAQAVDGLRQLERERVTRQHLGVSARSTFTRAPLLASRSNGKTGSPGRNDVEHASLLAAQGDVNGAISLLKPVAATSGNDAGARRLLGDLYLRQADALWPQQRTAAITAAESGVLADPSNKTLRERLASWKAAVNANGNASANTSAGTNSSTRAGAETSATAAGQAAPAARVRQKDKGQDAAKEGIKEGSKQSPSGSKSDGKTDNTKASTAIIKR
jgi:hypothetical protein